MVIAEFFLFQIEIWLDNGNLVLLHFQKLYFPPNLNFDILNSDYRC